MQKEILAKYPKADVRVYAIWFDMYPGDARAEWPSDLLTDARVTHRWDEGKVVGTFFGKNKARLQPRLSPDSSGMDGEILWDAYLLYGASARWNDFPDGLEHVGRTIVAGRDTLKKDCARLFAPPVSSQGPGGR